jgi:hypothetical protein
MRHPRGSLCGALGGGKRSRDLGCDAARCAAACGGEGLGFVEPGAAFPMLEELVEAEAGGAQRGVLVISVPKVTLSNPLI